MQKFINVVSEFRRVLGGFYHISYHLEDLNYIYKYTISAKIRKCRE